MSLPPSPGCGVLLTVQRGRVAGPSPQARDPGRFQRPLFLACFGPSCRWSSQPRLLIAGLLQVDDFLTLLLHEEIPPTVKNLKSCFLICLLPDLRRGSRAPPQFSFFFPCPRESRERLLRACRVHLGLLGSFTVGNGLGVAVQRTSLRVRLHPRCPAAQNSLAGVDRHPHFPEAGGLCSARFTGLLTRGQRRDLTPDLSDAKAGCSGNLGFLISLAIAEQLEVSAGPPSAVPPCVLRARGLCCHCR